MSNLVNHRYWVWQGEVDGAFCDYVLNGLNWDTSEEGVVRTDEGDYVAIPKLRATDIIWQKFVTPLGCLIRTYMEAANVNAGWDFVLNTQEGVQLSRYKSVNQGHYDWHTDSHPPENGIQRKLSCVILLNDPSEFEGGVLQFKGMEDEVVLHKKGSIVVFPAFIEHRVTPVTKGVRYTAVNWASGPSFK